MMKKILPSVVKSFGRKKKIFDASSHRQDRIPANGNGKKALWSTLPNLHLLYRFKCFVYLIFFKKYFI